MRYVLLTLRSSRSAKSACSIPDKSLHLEHSQEYCIFSEIYFRVLVTKDRMLPLASAYKIN